MASNVRARAIRAVLREKLPHTEQNEDTVSNDLEEMGPIDYLVVEFPGNKMTGEGLPILVDLVERGIIRIIDLAFFMKAADGSVAGVNIADLGDGEYDLTVFEGASSGLISQDDIDEASAIIEPGSSVGILVYENVWAGPFAAALRRGGGQLVAQGRIPVQALLAALDAAGVGLIRTVDRERPHPTNEREPTMPGLLRGMARTAVVAGTATAVSNRVSRRQAGRWAQQDQQQYEQQQQYAQPPAAGLRRAAACRGRDGQQARPAQGARRAEGRKACSPTPSSRRRRRRSSPADPADDLDGQPRAVDVGERGVHRRARDVGLGRGRDHVGTLRGSRTRDRGAR